MHLSDMEQRKRNIRLAGVLVLLVAASLVLHLIPGERKSSLKNVALFQLQDTAAVNKIEIKSKTFDHTLVKSNGQWTINSRYIADPSIMHVLLTVMTKVEITRPIPKSEEAEMEERFADSGIEVHFYNGEERIHSLEAGSNRTKTISVFKSSEGGYYVVNFPGYDSYVTGIFEITEIDWRDRLLLSATPGNLQKLTVAYPEGEMRGFEVVVKGNFPLIEDMTALDTTKLMDYLDQFQYFQADNFIQKGSNQKYDSLAGTQPYSQFTFENLIGHERHSLTFFPRIPGDNYIMAIVNEEDTVIFSHRRVAGIFREKEYFGKNP